MFCENCGNEIKGEAKFCSKCGNPINIYKSVPSLSQKYNRNISNNWFAKIDKDVIEKICDGFSGIILLFILLIFHSSIGDLWSETSNKFVAILHISFFAGKFAFLEIPVDSW